MRDYRYAWYIDNRFYVSKGFVDEFIDVVLKIKKTNDNVDGVALSKYYPDDDNASSRSTFARNVGIIDSNADLSDSALMYKHGFIDYSEFVLEIMTKRNTTGREQIPLKPVVLLCIVFSKMMELNIPKRERFITSTECYEYLSPLESYEELTNDLVSQIVHEREYLPNSDIPINRVKIDSGAVYLSSLFNCLNDTPIFYFGERKTILYNDDSHADFIQYMAANGPKISMAPIMGGSPKKNEPFYRYLCDINNGIFEIFPKIEIIRTFEPKKIKPLFEHCFGIKKVEETFFDGYMSPIEFGAFSSFRTVVRLVATYFYIKDTRLGELLFDYIAQCIDKQTVEDNTMIRVPFVDTNHTIFDEHIFLTPDWFKKKAEEYKLVDQEAKQLYIDFRAKFSPEQISKLTGSDILQTLFYSGDSNKENLCYILEKHPRYKDLFGSIDGGSAYKFLLFFHSEKQSWVTGTGQKAVNLSVSEAIALGQEIRDALVNGANIIENNTNLNSIEDYLALYNQLLGCIPKYIKYQWVLKYYHMLFPHLFPVFYSLDWQQHVLHNLNIVPNDETFIRMGQIALFVKQCDISQAVFSKIIHDYVGDIKSFLRIGTGDHGSLFNEWKTNNYVAVGWNFLGSLDSYCNDSKKKELQKDVIIEQLLTNCPSYDKKTASRKYGEISSFYAAVKENTYFVAMDGQTILGIAILKGDYKFDETKTYAHYREVEWIKLTNDDVKLPVNEALRTTCVEIEESENIIFLYSLIRKLKTLDDEVETAGKDQEMREIKMIDREPRKNKIHPLNQILYGAPGTGKTYATAEYALAVIENRAVNETQKTESERKALMQEYKNYISTGQIVFTTFHQSYGYEDFIQGLRPDTSSGEMKFHVVDGVFKNIAQRAMLNPDKNYVIIIDEINRANISKVFGELITLIEEDKRWGELNAVSVTLPSGEPFAVPNNLYIIGTMNSADKSISLIDTALRRRFSFIEKAPRADMISDGKMRTVLETLNGYIKQELKSTDLLIGHAFFIGKNENELCDLMNENIIPLLYEYFYDDENKVKKALDCLKDTKYEIDKFHIGRIRVKAKE